eukprot:TRINITY_DN3728_c0_g1_i1.p1 TRINITY_DN3728_c0_g1~~TRINITY_DN3728_c0_g1_i1.p1  ORF type:complete len:452 (-),score=100.01 TRINITY_DN3728_c0_g1_i1:222-1529(-)
MTELTTQGGDGTTITLDDLAQRFHMRINDVAKELRVCTTVLKKVCRRYGIPRWPHRKIKSMDKSIETLEYIISAPHRTTAIEITKATEDLQTLRKQREMLLLNPAEYLAQAKRAANERRETNPAPKRRKVPSGKGYANSDSESDDDSDDGGSPKAATATKRDQSAFLQLLEVAQGPAPASAPVLTPALAPVKPLAVPALRASTSPLSAPLKIESEPAHDSSHQQLHETPYPSPSAAPLFLPANSLTHVATWQRVAQAAAQLPYFSAPAPAPAPSLPTAASLPPPPFPVRRRYKPQAPTTAKPKPETPPAAHPQPLIQTLDQQRFQHQQLAAYHSYLQLQESQQRQRELFQAQMFQQRFQSVDVAEHPLKAAAPAANLPTGPVLPPLPEPQQRGRVPISSLLCAPSSPERSGSPTSAPEWNPQQISGTLMQGFLQF